MRTQRLLQAFVLLLLVRLLYPFFASPLDHLFSDPQRHWDNGGRFLHPDFMGSSDPFLYQAWIFALRTLAQDSAPTICLACGVLCALMPYGWYRALRELVSRERALGGALVIGLIPESLNLYAYFMNETLLFSLLGFCFWATFRAVRKRTPAAFAVAAMLWSCAAFTRTIAVPMAAACLLWLWILHGNKPQRLLIATLAVLVIAVPAGLHARIKLGFFSPFGNPYFNQIYSIAGTRDIAVNFGANGAYGFGSPSFYNPTFYPFSSWTTDRTGVATFALDLDGGRAAWRAAKAQLAAQRTFPRWRQRGEEAMYALFGQPWPGSDRATLMGWLSVWTRWLWMPLIVWVTLALAGRRYRGRATVLPLCAVGTFVLLLLQTEGVMEARYREPLDALFVCSALLVAPRRPATAGLPGAALAG